MYDFAVALGLSPPPKKNSKAGEAFVMKYIRFESLKEDAEITEKRWIEAVLSIPELRLVTKERAPALRLERADLSPMAGDAELRLADGSWLYCIQWIAAARTALLEAPDEVIEPEHYYRPIIAELAKRLDAAAIDDDELHYEGDA